MAEDIERLKDEMVQRRTAENAILDIVERIDKKMDEQGQKLVEQGTKLDRHGIELKIIRSRLDEQEVTLAEHSQLLRTLAQGQQQIMKLLSQPKTE